MASTAVKSECAAAQWGESPPPASPPDEDWNNRAWDFSSHDHGPLRAHVALQLTYLLQTKGGGGIWCARGELGGFVARLEEALYRTAASIDEYADAGTLEARLRRVAEALLRRARAAESSR
ncbi:unnamed protein product [Ostreobium quekettii]|uniref:Uncharacterized protein n=1 Tax=Ostreobium quekettii TaxID=121088 RepID=A0A8S1JFH9_9CHLO|nr:unnamed protein product [Ostreobium quekettii]